MSAELKGFWSYVRRDDEALGGVITRLSEHVVDEYEFRRGDGTIDLFRDTAKIRWGDIWREKVRVAIGEGSFFIPIVTPRFLTSDECRRELLEFAEQEEELGREGMIMPLYFAEVAAIEEEDKRDPVVRILLKRHREDWRERRLLDRSVQPYRKAVDKLVGRLVEIAESRPPHPGTRTREKGEGPERGGGGPGGQGPAAETIAVGPGKASGPPSSVEDAAAEESWALEQLAQGEEAVPRVGEALTEIAKVLDTVGELARTSSAEIERGNEQGTGFKGRLAIVNRLARHLVEPAARLQELTSQYTTDLEVVDPALTRMIDLAAEQYESAPDEAEQFFDGVIELIEHSGAAAEQIGGMIEAMESPAQFSRELNAPITSMRGSLQSMLDADEVIGGWREHISRAREGRKG
jgi:hypothetical protein